MKGLARKNSVFFQEFLKLNAQIFCFSETFLTKKFTNKILSCKYDLLDTPAIKTSVGRPSGGLLIGQLKNSSAKLAIIEQFQYFSILKYSQTSQPWTIFFVYLPPNGQYDYNFRFLFDKVRTYTTNNNRVLIMGDLNARIGDFDTIRKSRSTMDKVVNPAGKKLHEELLETGLLISNGNFPGDEYGVYTFEHENRRGMSTVDLCLYNFEMESEILDFQVKESAFSDHHPILVHVRQRNNTKAQQLSTDFQTPLRTKIRYDCNTIQYRNDLDTMLHSINPNTETLNETNFKLHNCIVNAAKKHNYYQISRSQETRRQERSHNSTWFNSECRTAKWEYKNALRHMRRCNTDAVAMLLKKQAYSDICKRKEEDERMKTVKQLLDYKDAKGFWHAVNKHKPKTQSSQSQITTEVWEEHYANIFEEPEIIAITPATTTARPVQTVTLDERLIRGINEQEIRTTIKRLKYNKAPGIDNIPNETWKLFTPTLLTLLTAIFQKCFEVGQVPSDWCQSVISPIYKKGDRKSPKNYRPIALLPTLLKVFTTTIASRLTAWFTTNNKISDMQAGFRVKTGCRDHIFALNNWTGLGNPVQFP